MRKAFAIVLGMTLLVCFIISYHPSTVLAGKVIKLTWADYAVPGDDRYEYYNHYIKRISEETNGRVEIKLYPAEQLVKAIQQYEALSRGTIDMCALVPVYYAGKILLACMCCETSYWTPGDSIVIVNRTIKEHSKILARDGITFMGWSAELPPMCLAGPRLFKTFEDIKGLKVRAPGISSKVVASWGATGVSVPNAEIYMALQRGVVDATYNTIATMKSQHLWEVTKAITFQTTGGSPTLVCMNTKKWNSLPEDIKAAFNKVNKEMPAWAYDHAVNYVKQTEDFLISKFEESYKESDPERIKMWREPAKGFIWKLAVKKFGAPAQQLWDKIMAVVQELNQMHAQGKKPEFK